MGVTLRKRKNADGTTSLRLDIYYKGKRTIETLSHLKLSSGKGLADRERNKEMVRQCLTKGKPKIYKLSLIEIMSVYVISDYNKQKPTYNNYRYA